MASVHLCNHCKDIPHEIRNELFRLKEIKYNPGGGKDYWAMGIQSKGIVETKDGLRFAANHEVDRLSEQGRTSGGRLDRPDTCVSLSVGTKHPPTA